MHPYLGAYTAGSVVYGVFNTKDLTTQAPITLAGTPSLDARKNATAAPDTSGFTLTVDYNSITGLHHWACATADDATFYAAPAEIFVCLAAGTVDGVSVVGQCVAQFSLAADGLTSAQETDVQTAAESALAGSGINPTDGVGRIAAVDLAVGGAAPSSPVGEAP